MDKNTIVRNKKDIAFKVKKLINVKSLTLIIEPKLACQLASKIYVDDNIHNGTNLRFHQTLENYHKVNVNGNVFILKNDTKQQLTASPQVKHKNEMMKFHSSC